MSIFDIFSEKNKQINRLCHYFYTSKRKITPFLIDLVENNPKIVDLLCNENVSIELFNKINNNNYTVRDMNYSNIDLYRQLPRKDNIPLVIDIVDKKINIDSVYQCFFCDNIVDSQEQLLERKISSFFDDLEIIYDSKKVCKMGITSSGNICIYSDASENDIFFYNGKKFIVRDVLKKSIVTMKFDYFISMIREKKFLEYIKNMKVVFQEDIKTYNKIVKNTSEVSTWITKQKKLLVKTNHLLYVIKNSNIVSKDKDYYEYLIKRIYSDNSTGICEKDHKIGIIAKQVSYKVRLDLLLDITSIFNKESKEIKLKEIDKPKYNLSVFLKDNNLIDIKNISENLLTCMLNELSEENLDNILSSDEIIDKYTTRTMLNISFRNLYSLEEIKDVIKNLVGQCNYEYKDNNKLFDVQLIYKVIVNGILYLIDNSQLSNIDKEYYKYKIEKYYFELNNKDYYKKYQSFNDISTILDSLVKEIGEYESNMLITHFNQSKEAKIKKINEPIFSVNVFIKDIKDFEKITLQDLTYRLSLLTLSELMIVLSSDEILNKYESLFEKGMSTDEKKKIILREIKIGSYNFNDDTINFIRKNNIDLDRFLAMPEAIVKTSEDINPILRRYKLSGDSKVCDISISNVIGHDYIRNNQNILSTIPLFFDSHGDGYHTRSIEMLNFSSKEIVNKLKNSFSFEPIVIDEVDKGVYIISNNGLHRFTVMRLNYLLELMGKSKKEDIDKKYTFKATVKQTDFFKTYCNYLLCNIDNDIKTVYNCYTDDYKIISDKVELRYNNGNKIKISSNELYEMVLSRIDNISSRILTEIEYYYKKIPSFKQFIDNYFKDLKLKFIDKGEVNVGNRKSK